MLYKNSINEQYTTHDNRILNWSGRRGTDMPILRGYAIKPHLSRKLITEGAPSRAGINLVEVVAEQNETEIKEAELNPTKNQKHDNMTIDEEENIETLNVSILARVEDDKVYFSFLIQDDKSKMTNNKLNILGNGKTTVNKKSPGYIFDDDREPAPTEYTGEINAMVEVLATIIQARTKGVIIPKKFNLIMKKPNLFDALLKGEKQMGPGCQTRLTMVKLADACNFDSFTFTKWEEYKTGYENSLVEQKLLEKQPEGGNNTVVKTNGQLRTINSSVILPTSTLKNLGKKFAKPKLEKLNAKINNRETVNENDKARADMEINVTAIINQGRETKQVNNPNDLMDIAADPAAQETPLDEMSWTSYGELLNVRSSTKNIPESLINCVRKLYSKIIKTIEETIEMDQAEEVTNQWLKRLEMIPIVLFTVKGSHKEKMAEMKKRLDWMTTDQWKLITYELVFEKKAKKGLPKFRKERAVDLMSQGLISKSFAYVKNSTKPQRQIEVNEEVLNKLEELHPRRQTPFLNNWMEDSIEGIEMPDITPDRVGKNIGDLKMEANPGLMQFRSEHIHELIDRKGGIRRGRDFLADYTRYINLICKGNKLPKSYHAFLGSCQAVPLPKGAADIRPIAIPHLARKIAEKCIADTFSGDFERHFRGLQFGVATPNGMEKIIHEIVEAKIANPQNDIVLLDSANAFNNQSRDVVFQETKTYFPEILPYVLSIYNQSTNLFVGMENGEVEILQSTMGAHQGAPLGSMIYSAGQQPLLRGAAEIFKSKKNAKARAYIDDTSVQGHIDEIEEGLEYLQRESPTYGIKFKNEKIKIFIGECSREEAEARVKRYQRIFGNNIPIGNFSLPGDAPITRGIHVMNIPIGTDEFIRESLSKTMEELKEDCEVISKVQQLQQRWTYIHYTLNGKINHLCRAINHHATTMELATKFEKLRKHLMEEILDDKLDDFQWFQSQLGISAGGFGMRSGQHNVLAGYLASGLEYVRYKVQIVRVKLDGEKQWVMNIMDSEETKDIYLRQIFIDALRIWRDHGDPTRNKQKYEWTEREERQTHQQGVDGNVEENGIEWLVRIIFKEHKPLQHLFYTMLYMKTANTYVKTFFEDPINSNANKARFRSASGEHAGKWLAAIPKDGFWMSSKEFRVALRLRMGLNVQAKNYKCTCGRASADDSHHYLNCKLGNQINNRHTSIVGVFSEMFKAAGQIVSTEVHLDEENLTAGGGRRSDLTLKRNNPLTGRSHHQHFDVTVVDPAAKSYITQNKSHLKNGVTARRAHNHKITYYADCVDREDFHPLVLEAFGYWTTEVSDQIKSACREISEEKEIPYSMIVNYWLTRLSFVLQWENAITIIEREDYSKNAARKNGVPNSERNNEFKMSEFKRYNIRPK